MKYVKVIAPAKENYSIKTGLQSKASLTILCF
jgi:hypothetical protein